MRFLVVFWLFVSTAIADDGKSLSGLQWLEKVDHAMRNLSYRGTVVLLKNGQLDTMKYRHGFEDGIEVETLSSLNSPLREVTRKANEISCLYKDSSQKVDGHQPIDRSFIVNLPRHFDNLDGQYLVAVTDQEMVAMRPVRLVAVLPKDELRYARKIWVDSETYLPLKLEVYGLDGHAIEQVVFTELVVDSVGPAAESAKSSSAHQHHRHHLTAEDFDKSAFQLKNWPKGFETVFFIRNMMQKGRKSVDHLLISDGFSSISVYFEAKGEHPVEGPRSLGAVNSFSKVLDNWQITVLGEVPAKTVELVAAGVAVR